MSFNHHQLACNYRCCLAFISILQLFFNISYEISKRYCAFKEIYPILIESKKRLKVFGLKHFMLTKLGKKQLGLNKAKIQTQSNDRVCINFIKNIHLWELIYSFTNNCAWWYVKLTLKPKLFKVMKSSKIAINRTASEWNFCLMPTAYETNR